jgi:GDP-4-dehydro-6-deoxy-D-mannose reductase
MSFATRAIGEYLRITGVLEMMKIINPTRTIVTGDQGFVGQHFCSSHGGVPLADRNGAIDLRDAARVRSAVAALAPEAVLHLAAQSSVAESFQDPTTTMAVNLLGTLNLLEALKAIQFQGVFVYVSSAEVYGVVADADLPTKETQPLRPRSPYAVSKVASEALCYQWSQTEKVRIIIARPFNLIGPGQDKRFAIADFARQIIEIRRGERPPFLVTGNLDVTRDFTDVRDAIRAYCRLLENGQNGEVYNICSGKERSLRALVEEMLRIARVEAELRTDTIRLRPVEQGRMVGDNTKLREQLGCLPEILLDSTLTDVLHEMEED